MLKQILLKPGGETLTYRETGIGPKVLLLIHGNMTSSKHWDLLMENFPGEYKIVAPDLRGFGGSSYNNPVNSFKDFSEDVRLFVDALGLEKFSIAGWSAGGAIAMQFAIDHPGFVSKLILQSSVGIKGFHMLKSNEKGQPVPGEFIKTRQDIDNDPQLQKIINANSSKNREFLRAVWNKLIYTQKQPEPEKYEQYLDDILTQRNLKDIYYSLVRFNISNEDNRVVPGTGEVDKIRVPTLVIHGDRDFIIPLETAEQIKKGIKENAELAVLENCGHSPLTDSLDRLTGLYVDFID
ncbi:MAG: alpha/beta hydrolase [Desulfobacterales bacterium]|nr:alpha/beta hydrolase [Desulfobacterales bacterium]